MTVRQPRIRRERIVAVPKYPLHHVEQDQGENVTPRVIRRLGCAREESYRGQLAGVRHLGRRREVSDGSAPDLRHHREQLAQQGDRRGAGRYGNIQGGQGGPGIIHRLAHLVLRHPRHHADSLHLDPIERRGLLGEYVRAVRLHRVVAANEGGRFGGYQV